MTRLLVATYAVSLGLLVYVYLGYPLLSILLGAFIRRPVSRRPHFPRVSILIAAYNEERHIRETIRNKLSLEYPADLLEVIVVSDGSTDRTDALVREFPQPIVRLLRQEPRQGKTAALNAALPLAGGEIIVFSDANSLYDRQALRCLAENFADEKVGYVTGRMAYQPPDDSPVGKGCAAFMDYENRLRAAETRLGSVIGVNGGIDAVRKRLFEPMPADAQPDFVLPLRVIAAGFRVVFDPRAVLAEESLDTTGREYRMRVRVSLRALAALWDMRRLLNPLRHGVVSWQLFSHKLLRYGAFLPLASLSLSNLLLGLQHPLFSLSLAALSLFYAVAAAGWLAERRGIRIPIAALPLYFCLVNVASAHAFLRALRGDRQVVWAPRTG